MSLYVNIVIDLISKGATEIPKIVSGYDQEIPQSQTAEKPMAS